MADGQHVGTVLDINLNRKVFRKDVLLPEIEAVAFLAVNLLFTRGSYWARGSYLCSKDARLPFSFSQRDFAAGFHIMCTSAGLDIRLPNSQELV